MRVILIGLAGLLTVALALRPPVALELPALQPGTPGGGEVRGIFHIHTRLSDGGGTVEEVARAAARAGLRFVITTDHGDGTRSPEPPVYRDGVLCVDAVEVSTTNGHLVALGIPQAPYPLGGEGRDVVEDVERLGGLAIAAHPTSPREGLRWTEWTAPFGGIEWLNGDAEWRDERPTAIARTLLTYPFRSSESIAALLDRPTLALQKWDALTRRRRVVGVAAADAHAHLGLPERDDPPTGRRSGLPLPGYEAVFRSFSVTATDVVFSGRADEDARTLIEAFRRGHLFSSVDGLARGGSLRLTASSGAHAAGAGDLLPLDGPVAVAVRLHGPEGARIHLLRDGAEVAVASGLSLAFDAPAEPAVYRAEIELPWAPGTPPVPWLVSNPIYAGRTDEVASAAARPAASATLPLQADLVGWDVEHSDHSLAALDRVAAAGGGDQAVLRWALAGVRSSAQFAAMTAPVPAGLAGRDRLTFTGRASRPMRVSVQIRVPTREAAGLRWARTVYLDREPREVSLSLDEFTPAGRDVAPHPTLADVRTVLFVLDSLHASLGTNGLVTITSLRAESVASPAQVRAVRTR